MAFGAWLLATALLTHALACVYLQALLDGSSVVAVPGLSANAAIAVAMSHGGVGDADSSDRTAVEMGLPRWRTLSFDGYTVWDGMRVAVPFVIWMLACRNILSTRQQPFDTGLPSYFNSRDGRDKLA